MSEADGWRKKYEVKLSLTAFELGTLIGILAKNTDPSSAYLFNKILEQTKPATDKIYGVDKNETSS